MAAVFVVVLIVSVCGDYQVSMGSTQSHPMVAPVRVWVTLEIVSKNWVLGAILSAFIFRRCQNLQASPFN
jgi:hypothetical protein